MASDFDGVDDQITIPDSAAWDSLTAITVMCWVNLDSVAARSDFFTRWGEGTPATSWNLLQGVTAARAEFFISDGVVVTGSTADTTDLPTDGTWVHLAGTWKSGSPVRIWRAGVNTASSANVTATMPNTAVQPRIGNGSESTPRFVNGRIAEVAIWNTELSATEIANIYNGMSPLSVRTTNLIGFWPLHGTVSPEPDWTGRNNHGTVAGALRSDHPPRISAYWLAPHPRRVQVVPAAAADVALDAGAWTVQRAPSAKRVVSVW